MTNSTESSVTISDMSGIVRGWAAVCQVVTREAMVVRMTTRVVGVVTTLVRWEEVDLCVSNTCDNV